MVDKHGVNIIYTAPTAERRFVQYPGYNGGSDWGGVAVDPRHGVIVANYNLTANFNRLVDRKTADKIGLYPAGEGAGYAGGILSAGIDGIKVGEAVALSLLQG